MAVVALAVVIGGPVLVDGREGDSADDSDEEAAAGEPTTTERRRPARTTEPAASPPLTLPAGMGFRVVSIGNASIVVTDLGVGAETTIDGGAGGGYLGVGVARGSGIVVVTAYEEVVYLPELVPNAEGVNLGEGNQIVPSDEPDRIWILGSDPSTDVSSTLREVDLSGHTTAGPITLPAGVATVGSVTGGLIVDSPDGIFLIDRDGDARRVARGTPIGTFGGSVIHHACDADLRCGVQVTEVSTGEQRQIDLPADALTRDSSYYGSSTISPDGRFVAWWVYSERAGGLKVVDLATGTVVPTPQTDLVEGGATMDWSPDGQWLLLHAPWVAPTSGAPAAVALRVADGTLLELDLPTGDYNTMVVLAVTEP